MWWRTRRFEREEQSMRALAALLLEDRSQARIHLYLEMTIVDCGILVLEELPGGMIASHANDMIRTQARELWTQFRLNDRPKWRALELSCSSSGEFSAAFIYDENFDTGASFSVRSRRWAVRLKGTEALAAIREFDINQG